MIAQAIHATAGVGIGTFLGCLIVLFAMKRGGRDIQLLRGSVFLTSVAAGMAAWVFVAALRLVL